MTIDPRKDPRSRMRNILSSGETTRTTPPDDSLLSRLPKARPAAAPSVPPPAPEELQPETPSFFQRFGPAFWTVTGLISLVVNGLLIALVLYLLSSVAGLQLTAGETGANVL